MAAYRRVDDLRSPAGWLPVHRDQLRAQRSVSSMGSLYLFFTQCKTPLNGCLSVSTIWRCIWPQAEHKQWMVMVENNQISEQLQWCIIWLQFGKFLIASQGKYDCSQMHEILSSLRQSVRWPLNLTWNVWNLIGLWKISTTCFYCRCQFLNVCPGFYMRTFILAQHRLQSQ